MHQLSLCENNLNFDIVYILWRESSLLLLGIRRLQNSLLVSECPPSDVFRSSLVFKCLMFAELRVSLWGFLERLINDGFSSCRPIDSIWAGREVKTGQALWRRCKLNLPCGRDGFGVWLVRYLSSLNERTGYEFKQPDALIDANSVSNSVTALSGNYTSETASI